jgi:hypothetical protein
MTYIAISRALRAAADRARMEQMRQVPAQRDPIAATRARMTQSNSQSRR